nr:MAG TPA: ENDO-1,4-BETA-XYLANASE Y [Caudoviricetes sp.]
MVKGANDVYTGELSLPEGTKFDIKILKSTVSTTTGGDNTWSAVRYVSTLNKSASHDFGEFTDNLIPNGNFDKGRVKWTPKTAIEQKDYAHSKPSVLVVTTKNVSDVFDVPANQSLQFTGYVYHNHNDGNVTVTVESVEPQQQTLLEFNLVPSETLSWHQFSGSFNSGDTPMKCQITITGNGYSSTGFDTLSLVSP